MVGGGLRAPGGDGSDVGDVLPHGPGAMGCMVALEGCLLPCGAVRQINQFDFLIVLPSIVGSSRRGAGLVV